MTAPPDPTYVLSAIGCGAKFRVVYIKKDGSTRAAVGRGLPLSTMMSRNRMSSRMCPYFDQGIMAPRFFYVDNVLEFEVLEDHDDETVA